MLVHKHHSNCCTPVLSWDASSEAVIEARNKDKPDKPIKVLREYEALNRAHLCTNELTRARPNATNIHEGIFKVKGAKAPTGTAASAPIRMSNYISRGSGIFASGFMMTVII
ncbi:hypothetical protein KC19_2G168700 [Ceratodon purpureus]|uniref:Uncharacterized protein n=1 Tax=Ceratodon purpureus TaxID=3225 RepID=A0A8T0IWA7_CERPU|nr:hypothetical protein KC19_2G168700 [Ceratodon purpureus]